MCMTRKLQIQVKVTRKWRSGSRCSITRPLEGRPMRRNRLPCCTSTRRIELGFSVGCHNWISGRSGWYLRWLRLICQEEWIWFVRHLTIRTGKVITEEVVSCCMNTWPKHIDYACGACEACGLCRRNGEEIKKHSLQRSISLTLFLARLSVNQVTMWIILSEYININWNGKK